MQAPQPEQREASIKGIRVAMVLYGSELGWVNPHLASKAANGPNRQFKRSGLLVSNHQANLADHIG
jgi:hypothetical protein